MQVCAHGGCKTLVKCTPRHKDTRNKLMIMIITIKKNLYKIWIVGELYVFCFCVLRSRLLYVVSYYGATKCCCLMWENSNQVIQHVVCLFLSLHWICIVGKENAILHTHTHRTVHMPKYSLLCIECSYACCGGFSYACKSPAANLLLLLL